MHLDSAQYEKFMGRWSERLTKPFLTFAESVDTGPRKRIEQPQRFVQDSSFRRTG
jgi:hypothetical protein